MDIIIEICDSVSPYYERVYSSFGWAIPDGFEDYGEILVDTAFREVPEEIGLKIGLLCPYYTYFGTF